MGRMIRFDSRDKKPALWSVLVLSVVTALIVALLLISGQAGLFASLVLDCYFLAVIVLLLAAFTGQLQYNPYSYNTIYYTGFSVFLLTVLITHLDLTVRMVRFPEKDYTGQAAFMLLKSARDYMRLSAPFILVFSAALCISNISLIRHEGMRFVNLLGIILSFLLVGGEAFIFRFQYYVAARAPGVRIYELAGSLFSAVYLYFECMLIGAIIADTIAARSEPEYDRDYIIILGCGIQKDGSPSPLLRGRVDRALRFRREQLERTGRDVTLITSGGQGPDEPVSESASMKRYLLEQGFPEAQILEEDRSSSTFENMKFSKEKILERDPDLKGKIAFSTTSYHVFRGGLYARRVKMRAIGMGEKTKWYFWPNASVREFVGLLTEHRGKQALIFGGIIAIYTALTLYVYR